MPLAVSSLQVVPQRRQLGEQQRSADQPASTPEFAGFGERCAAQKMCVGRPSAVLPCVLAVVTKDGSHRTEELTFSYGWQSIMEGFLNGDVGPALFVEALHAVGTAVTSARRFQGRLSGLAAETEAQAPLRPL